MLSAGVPKLDSLINIDQEEDDDDLIYECPGLAPHGEMEVTNPFFLGKDFNTHIGEVEGGEKREGRKCEKQLAIGGDSIFRQSWSENGTCMVYYDNIVVPCCKERDRFGRLSPFFCRA